MQTMSGNQAAQTKNGSPNLTQELHSMSGLGVRPSLISFTECDTTLSQYCVVMGTTCSSTPRDSHTLKAMGAIQHCADCIDRDRVCGVTEDTD